MKTGLMETGKFYRITEIRAPYLTPLSPRWWPVIGTLHQDREIIGFSPRHYHIDNRFIPGPLMRKMLETEIDDGEPMEPALAVITMAAPVGWDPEDPRNQRERMTVRGSFRGKTRHVGISLSSLPSNEFPPETYVRTAVRKLRRQYGEFPEEETEWLPALREAYRDAQLTGNMICPHRGTDLSGVAPGPDGNVTCPLHGLRWNPRTGKAV